MTPEQLMKAQRIDVSRTAQAKEIAEQKHRSQIYSLATTIMVKNSESVIVPNMVGIDEIALKAQKEEVVRQSLQLAKMQFEQIELEEKEHAERRNAELSGTKSSLQLP